MPETHVFSAALVLFRDHWRLQKELHIWFTDSINDDMICVFSRAAAKCNGDSELFCTSVSFESIVSAVKTG